MYFDWTATTPISEESLNEYIKIARNVTGNPSSDHSEGLKAKELLNIYRCKCAELLKTKSENIYFTSGGTESDSIIFSSLLNSPSPKEIITTTIEHSAIAEYKTILTLHGWKFNTVSCPNGFVNLDKFRSLLNQNTKLVSIMAVNNVTGTVQNLQEIIRIVRDFQKETGRKIHIHTDAVQAVGKIPFRLDELDIDSASISAHKIYGPRGIGILYCRDKSLSSISRGGGQENGLRPGTENVPAIGALTKALEFSVNSLDSRYKYVEILNKKIRTALKDEGIKILSPEENTSPFILNISVKNTPSQVFLRVLNDKGFCLSAGSACSSNSRGKAESVLNAMNYEPADRLSSVRISLSDKNTEEEVDKLIQTIIETHRKL